MKKFLILGLLVVTIPLLGIPIAWKTFSLILTGLFIIFSSITYKKNKNKDSRRKEGLNDLETDRVFVENEEKLE